MITFRRIRRREFLHFFVSILRVIVFIVQKMSKNAHNVASPQKGKPFKLKIRMSKKGTSAQIIMQVWAIFGQNRRLHVPNSAKPFFGKQECPQKGHPTPRNRLCCTP